MTAASACTAPRSRVSRAAASRAVNSLLKWIRSRRNSHGVASSGHDDPIYLILTLSKTPQKLHSKPYLVPLPHPLHDASTTISLILDDRPNSPLSLSSARGLIRSLSLPISQIIPLSDIRSGILPAGELLFVDRRIARLLRSFEKKGRNKKSIKWAPVEVDFSRKAWPEYVKRVCFSTVFNLGSGTCCGIRVGRASQGSDLIVDNAIAAVDGSVCFVPRKWSNVVCCHLKTSESLALPIYKKSDWANKKVAADDDEDSEEEEEEGEEEAEEAEAEEEKEERLEDEKHEQKGTRAEGVILKRARDGDQLDGGKSGNN